MLWVNVGGNTKEARDATWSGVLNKIKQVLKLIDLNAKRKAIRVKTIKKVFKWQSRIWLEGIYEKIFK